MKINKLLLCSLAGIFISMLCASSVRCFLIGLPIPKGYEADAGTVYIMFWILVLLVCMFFSAIQISRVAIKQSNKFISFLIYMSMLSIAALVFIAGSIGPTLCQPSFF